nr:phosphopentomutase [Clostridia bacterium]
MKRKAIIIVLDSVGIGALPDAARYGDLGANTLAHVAERVDLRLPNLLALGLGNIEGSGLSSSERPLGAYGRMKERAQGKDTTSGHWEIAGLTLEKAFPVFPDGFPQAFIEAFEAAIGRKTLGNYASSGTVILDQLGEEHLRTGHPIVYTSADSVFQIAAHEEIIPPEELYAICRTARDLLAGGLAVGRVIARPFSGKPGSFVRTGNRRDFSLEPPGDTLLDVLKRAGYAVLGVGKIEDIFAHRGLTDSDHASGNEACVDA